MIDFAPHIFRTVLAQHAGEFLQFRYVDFQHLAADRAAAAFAARYQVILGGLILTHARTAIFDRDPAF